MSSGHTGGREIVADIQARKTVSFGFCGVIMKYWLWQQL
jgi:hypothetical protein